MKTLMLYTFDELSPGAQERALSQLPDFDVSWILDECMDSLKALCKVAGITLRDWSIGPYSPSWIKVDIGSLRDGSDIEDLSGPRALAWIENRIFGPLRQSYSLRAKGRRYTRPDHVPACPLTGVSFDEDLLDVFRSRDMRVTLQERFESLADIIRTICEREIDYQNGEGRWERAEVEFDGVDFDENGRIR